MLFFFFLKVAQTSSSLEIDLKREEEEEEALFLSTFEQLLLESSSSFELNASSILYLFIAGLPEVEVKLSLFISGTFSLLTSKLLVLLRVSFDFSLCSVRASSYTDFAILSCSFISTCVSRAVSRMAFNNRSSSGHRAEVIPIRGWLLRHNAAVDFLKYKSNSLLHII